MITSSSTNTEIPLRSARKRQDRDSPCLFKWSQPLLFQLCTAQWRHHVCKRSSMSFFWTVSPWRAVVLWRRYIRPLISFMLPLLFSAVVWSLYYRCRKSFRHSHRQVPPFTSSVLATRLSLAFNTFLESTSPIDDIGPAALSLMNNT